MGSATNESVGSPLPRRNNMSKRAARRTSRRKGAKPSYEARKAGMSLDEQRRACKIQFLNRWPKIIPKRLFVECRKLFKRRAEMITDDDARYEHDMARRKAVELLSRERVKEGLDTEWEAYGWGNMAKTEKEVWRENEAEEMGWIIEHLEAKNKPFNEGFMATEKGKLAAWRDFLHAILRLENNGGVPDRMVPWLRDLLSHKAYAKSKESERAAWSWKLGVQQALNFIVACRRQDGVKGTYELTGEHRCHRVEIDEWCRDWSPEDFLQEEWAAVRGGMSIGQRIYNMGHTDVVTTVGGKAENDDALAERESP
jgi:hypothetical protein